MRAAKPQFTEKNKADVEIKNETKVTDDQLNAKKKYAGEKKPSMKRRDSHHDYRERRMYMITLEVEGRRPLFGRVVGNACARGALLMLAPWEHQNEKQKITSAQCRQMNLMALEICEPSINISPS